MDGSFAGFFVVIFFLFLFLFFGETTLHFIKESHLENPRPGLSLLFFSSLGWVPPPNIIKCFFLVRPSDPASPFWWHPTKSNAKGEQWGSEPGNKDEADGVIRRVLNGEKKVTAQQKSLSLGVDCAVRCCWASFFSWNRLDVDFSFPLLSARLTHRQHFHSISATTGIHHRAPHRLCKTKTGGPARAMAKRVEVRGSKECSADRRLAKGGGGRRRRRRRTFCL